MKKGTDILNVAPEDFEGTITPEQQEALDANASKPWGEEAEEEVKKLEESNETDKDDDSKDGDSDYKDSDDSDKDKEEDGKDDEESDEEDEKESEEEQLKKIAEEDGITVEEAKENLSKDKALIERHGNDSIKIARALRKEQSQYGKLKNSNDKLVEFKQEVEAQRKKYNEQAFNNHCEEKRDEYVEKYVKYHPEQSDVSEEVLFERAKNELKGVIKQNQEKEEVRVKEASEIRREELLDNLPEEFNEVKVDIKNVLKEVENSHVLTKDFDIMHIAHYARGKKYTPEHIKSLTEAAEKRGREESKIKEKKTVPAGGRGGKKSPATSLSEDDKSRAHDIYANEEWDEAKIFSEFIKNHKGKDFFD